MELFSQLWPPNRKRGHWLVFPNHCTLSMVLWARPICSWNRILRWRESSYPNALLREIEWDKDLLSSFLSSLLGIGQRPGISFTCLEISELSLFDPLIIGTGKLYSNDDNGWLYSLCDAIRQRYIFPFTMVLYIHSSPFRSQGILLLIPINQSICITYPSSDLKKKQYPTNKINSSYIHEQ